MKTRLNKKELEYVKETDLFDLFSDAWASSYHCRTPPYKYAPTVAKVMMDLGLMPAVPGYVPNPENVSIKYRLMIQAKLEQLRTEA